ncbi:MAG: T9SS type A sorting domain-containing protein, partial [Bacteroidetes bacterium]|nr:T9SS type A sorting domain-containing protein [Bacteroidota bacterium]
LYLIGYDFSTAYFYQWEYPNFDDSALHKYSLNIPSGYSYQIEGLSNADSSKFYISSEALGTSLSALYLFDFELLSSLHHLNKEPSFIFPNPASEWIEIKQENASSFEVYNLSGQLVLQSNTAIFSVSMLELGCYAILSKDKQGQILGKDILLLKK